MCPYNDCGKRFNEKGNLKNIRIHQQWFNDEIAKQYGSHGEESEKRSENKILFISDVRTELGDDWKENETWIWKDMKNQQRWVELMKPKSALLCFKLPLGETFESMNDGNGVIYLDGDLLVQPFGPPEGRECRLHVTPTENGEYKKRLYNVKQYDSAMFYHNTIIRTMGDTCHDCLSEECIYQRLHQVKNLSIPSTNPPPQTEQTPCLPSMTPLPS